MHGFYTCPNGMVIELFARRDAGVRIAVHQSNGDVRASYAFGWYQRTEAWALFDLLCDVSAAQLDYQVYEHPILQAA